MDKCFNKVKHESYSITINYKNKNNPRYFPFIFFLAKKQNKNNQKALKNKSKYTITFSGDHFKNTCKQTLDLNTRFHYLLSHKFLSPQEVKKLKQELEEINTMDGDDFISNVSALVKREKEIKSKLKSNKNLNIQSREFSNLDNTPKKTTQKRVQIDDTLSKEDFF